MANTWQGEFPIENIKEDGYEGTAPVGSPSSGHGLIDMIGIVWEWTTDWVQGSRRARRCLLHESQTAGW